MTLLLNDDAPSPALTADDIAAAIRAMGQLNGNELQAIAGALATQVAGYAQWCGVLDNEAADASEYADNLHAALRNSGRDQTPRERGFEPMQLDSRALASFKRAA